MERQDPDRPLVRSAGPHPRRRLFGTRQVGSTDARTITPVVFVSKSFDVADRKINSYFERLMKAAGITLATAEEWTDEPIPVRVERVLSGCDFLVGVYVVRYEDKNRKRVVTSQWLMRETWTAHGQGKNFIALVEDGVSDVGGLDIDKELIMFRRDDLVSMQEATVKFIQALRWHGLLRQGACLPKHR